MLSISKTYQEIPFAHRQHKHAGHCRFVHGHSWSIKLTLGLNGANGQLDANGFILDFGQMKFIKKWIDDNLDHAFLVNEDDTVGRQMVETFPECFKVLIIPSGSAEGLARFFYEKFDFLIREQTENRVWVLECTVFEDSRNTATFAL